MSGSLGKISCTAMYHNVTNGPVFTVQQRGKSSLQALQLVPLKKSIGMYVIIACGSYNGNITNGPAFTVKQWGHSCAI